MVKMNNIRDSFQPPWSVPRGSIGKIIYFFIIVSIVILFSIILKNDLGYFGWDAKVFCRAGRALSEGHNPYLIDELGGEFSWNYLPIYARGFLFVCSRFAFADNYIFLYAILFLFGMAPWLEKDSWLYGIVLCATGLYGLGWVLRSGNVGVIELFLISMAALLLLKGRYNLSLFILGLAASIKLFPILYFPVFIAIIPGWKPKVRAAIFGGMGFLLPFLASALIYPELTPWYFKQILGLIPNQHLAINESGGLVNPSLAYLLAGLLSIEIQPTAELVAAFLLYLLMLIFLFRVWKTSLSNPEKAGMEFALGFGIAAATIFMPRIKPYSFMPALLSFYLMTREYNEWGRGLFLLALSLFPLTAYYGIQHEITFSALTWMPGTMKNIAVILYQYHQTFFLLVSLGILMALQSSGKLLKQNRKTSNVQTR